jgi:hypothetical protein
VAEYPPARQVLADLVIPMPADDELDQVLPAGDMSIFADLGARRDGTRHGLGQTLVAALEPCTMCAGRRLVAEGAHLEKTILVPVVPARIVGKRPFE